MSSCNAKERRVTVTKERKKDYLKIRAGSWLSLDLWYIGLLSEPKRGVRADQNDREGGKRVLLPFARGAVLVLLVPQRDRCVLGNVALTLLLLSTIFYFFVLLVKLSRTIFFNIIQIKYLSKIKFEIFYKFNRKDGAND